MKSFVMASLLALTSFFSLIAAHAGEAEIKARLAKVLPANMPYKIQPEAINGFRMITAGLNVFYVSEDGRYLMTGDLVDLQTRTNVTEQKERALRVAMLKALPNNEFIEYKAKGTEKGVIYAFTDVDCPYCHKLHAEVDALNAKGVSVKYLAYPRTRPGSPSWTRSQSVWCGENRQALLEAAMAGQQVPMKSCQDPVAKHQSLGSEMGVNGTPAMILPSGELLPGYGKASEILKAMGIQ